MLAIKATHLNDCTTRLKGKSEMVKQKEHVIIVHISIAFHCRSLVLITMTLEHKTFTRSDDHKHRLRNNECITGVEINTQKWKMQLTGLTQRSSYLCAQRQILREKDQVLWFQTQIWVLKACEMKIIRAAFTLQNKLRPRDGETQRQMTSKQCEKDSNVS